MPAGHDCRRTRVTTRAAVRWHTNRSRTQSSAHVRLFSRRRGIYSMAMPAQPTEWTVEMVRALPDDGNRHEVIGGELFVTPAPSWTHQRAVGELYRALMPYLEEHALGVAIIAPADVLFGPRDMVEPDLFV